MAKDKSLGVGDHVRLLSRSANKHKSYEITENPVVPVREPVDGLILSIREIATGKLMASTTGDLEGFVIEILSERTFNSRFSSLINAPRGSEQPSATPRWRRLREVLREAAAQGQLFSAAMPGNPLAKYLDGWKVIKVRSNEIETQELPEIVQVVEE